MTDERRNVRVKSKCVEKVRDYDCPEKEKSVGVMENMQIIGKVLKWSNIEERGCGLQIKESMNFTMTKLKMLENNQKSL